MIKAISLTREAVAQCLGLILPHIERFVAKYPADYTVGQFIGGLLDGKAQGFVCWDEDGKEIRAFALGEVLTGFDGSRTLKMHMIEGAGLSEWRDALQAEFDRFAAQAECRAILFIGRKGWKPLLPGWRVKFHVYERAVLR